MINRWTGNLPGAVRPTLPDVAFNEMQDRMLPCSTVEIG
jgi:hypothetical protein